MPIVTREGRSPGSHAFSRFTAALGVGAMLVAGPLLAGDLPALVDERQPTVTPSLQQVRDADPQRSATEVSLPSVAEAISRDTQVPVAHIDVRGGTVFELDELVRDLRPMLGERVTVAQLIEAVEGITERYQEAGYPLSYAYLPDDNFHNGVVTVVVVEGYIARTELDIASSAVASRVERLARRIVGERPLSRDTFERYTALMERIPGAQLAINAPVPRTPGGGTTLRVEERSARPVDAGLSLQGGSEDDIRLLANLTLQANTRYAERLSLSALLPIDSDDEYYAAEYRQELGDDGLRLSASASRFDTQERGRTVLEGERFDTREEKVTERYRLGLDYPLRLSRRLTWELGGHLDHHHQRTDLAIDLGNGDEFPLQQQLNFSVAELNTRLQRRGESRLFELSGDIRQGLDIGGNRNRLRSPLAQVEGSEDLHFTRLGSQARWVERLGERWRLSTRLAGFWSEDALPSPEQGNYGGSRFGRGYGESQAEGDYGAAGELELRYLHPVEGSAWVSSIEPYALLDGARTRFNHRDLDHEIASAVAGVEVARGSTYRLGVEYAQPIGDRDIDTDSRDARLNARISWHFGG